MAIYHCSAKIVSRSTGRSSVAAAAYRSGEKLLNSYDGITHDYTGKRGIIYSEVMLCKNAPNEYRDREILWNEVEKIEKGSRAQLAREIEIALPTEFNRKAQIELVQDYVRSNFVNAGMCADICIHDKKDGNPHAHIMLTMRSINEKGQWGSKSKKVYQLDEHGNKIYDAKKRQYKCTKENTTDWNDKKKLVAWREQWSEIVNQAYEKKSLSIRIDHRSLQAQGINREPTIHEGSAAHQMDRRGLRSDRGNINREIKQRNSEYERAYKETYHEDDKTIGDPYNSVTIKGQNESSSVRKNSTVPITSIKDDIGEDRLSAERIVELLSLYKTQYVLLKQEMHNISVNTATLQKQEQKLENRAIDMEDRYDGIQELNSRIIQLQQQRMKMGVFKGKEKKQLDRQINQLTHSHEQMIQSFEHEFDINPYQATEVIHQLRAQTQDLRSGNQIPDIKEVQEKLKSIELAYKIQKALADISPDRRNIEKMLLQTTERFPSGKKSIKNRMLMAETETVLNNISLDDYQRIVKLVKPVDAKKIVEFVKQRRPERKQQKRNSRDMIK